MGKFIASMRWTIQLQQLNEPLDKDLDEWNSFTHTPKEEIREMYACRCRANALRVLKDVYLAIIREVNNLELS